MRLLARNKKELWFANPTGSEWVEDANGLKTGERKITYGTAKSARMSIAISSGANNLGSQGMVELQRYGLTTGYTHRATTEDMNCEMGEESIVWYGIPPTHEVEYQETVNGETVTLKKDEPNPHNFTVVRRSASLNHIIYYLKEVDVSL